MSDSKTPAELSLAAKLEALLFVATEPVPLAQLGTALDLTPAKTKYLLDELDESLARKLEDEVDRGPEHIQAAEEAAVPFASLHEVEPGILAELLIREHPQTIAIVMAHLPPKHVVNVSDTSLACIFQD